jgi:mono/diheme cytochrome c family protein
LLFIVALAGAAGCSKKQEKADPLAEARMLYAGACARCHGMDGKSGLASLGGTAPRNLADPAFQKARTDQQLLEVIANGKGAMPGFGKLYRPEELTGLVQVVRGFNLEASPAPSGTGSPP